MAKDETDKHQKEPVIYWIALTGIAIIMFVGDGFIKSYGLIYLELLQKYEEGAQRTGLVATVFAATGILVGPIAGWLVDKCGAGKVIIVGAILAAAGAIIAAFAPTITLAIVGFGVIHGGGSAGFSAAALAAATKLFIYNRNIAMTILFSGSSIGMIVYPFIFHGLLEAYTLRGVLLVYSGFLLNFLPVGALLITIDKHHAISTIESKDISISNKPERVLIPMSTITSNEAECAVDKSETKLQTVSPVKEELKQEREESKSNIFIVDNAGSEAGYYRDAKYKETKLQEKKVETVELKHRRNESKRNGVQHENGTDKHVVNSNKENTEYSKADKATNTQQDDTEMDKERRKHIEIATKVRLFVKSFFTLSCLELFLYYLTFLFATFGYMMYLPAYAEELMVPPIEISTLVAVFGAMELVSIISIGLLTNFLKVNIYILTIVNSVLVGCLTLLLPLIIKLGVVYVALMINVAVFGLLVGGLTILIGQFVVDAFGLENAGAGIGITTASFSIALMLPPLTYGGLKEKTDSYAPVQYVSGGSLLLSAIIIAVARFPYCMRSVVHRGKLQINK